MDDAAPPKVVDTDLLQLLEAVVRKKAQRLLDTARANGVVLVVTSTLRTFEEQDQLYRIGRTEPGRRVTNARAGYSWHNFGRAFDCAFLVQGRRTWMGDWERVGKWAEEAGLEWGGRWKKFPDTDHFQDPGGMTLRQARELWAEEEAQRDEWKDLAGSGPVPARPSMK